MGSIRKINVNGTNYDIADEKLFAEKTEYPGASGMTKDFYPIVDIDPDTDAISTTKMKDTDIYVQKLYTTVNGATNRLTGIVFTASGSAAGGLHTQTLYPPVTGTNNINYLPSFNGTLLNDHCITPSSSGMQFAPTTVTNYIPVVMNPADLKLYAAAPATGGANITMRVWS